MGKDIVLSIRPNWDPKSRTHVVCYMQATQAGVYSQRVTIDDPNNKHWQKESGPTSNQNFGRQFLNEKVHLDPNAVEYQFTVRIENDPTGNGDWRPNDYEYETMIVGAHAAVGVVASNDAGADKDYNDCVLLIGVYNYSDD
jgi:hypothetical protein